MNQIPGMMVAQGTGAVQTPTTSNPLPPPTPGMGNGGAGATVGATLPQRPRMAGLAQGQAMEVRAPDNVTPARPANPTGRPAAMTGGMMMRRATTG
jgi:hypothetical protein